MFIFRMWVLLPGDVVDDGLQSCRLLSTEATALLLEVWVSTLRILRWPTLRSKTPKSLPITMTWRTGRISRPGLVNLYRRIATKVNMSHVAVDGKWFNTPLIHFLLNKLRGNVTNILFENFYIKAASYAAAINQNSGDNGSYKGTSNMLVSDITFANFTGYLTASNTTNRTTSVSCSTRIPCYNVTFLDFELEPREDAGYEVGATGSCAYIADGGVVGMTGSGC